MKQKYWGQHNLGFCANTLKTGIEHITLPQNKENTMLRIFFATQIWCILQNVGRGETIATFCFHWLPNDSTNWLSILDQMKKRWALRALNTIQSTMCRAVCTLHYMVINHHLMFANISSKSKLVLCKTHSGIFTVELYPDLALFVRLLNIMHEIFNQAWNSFSILYLYQAILLMLKGWECPIEVYQSLREKLVCHCFLFCDKIFVV